MSLTSRNRTSLCTILGLWIVAIEFKLGCLSYAWGFSPDRAKPASRGVAQELFLAPQQLGLFETLEVQKKTPVAAKYFGIHDSDPLIPFHDAWRVQQDQQQMHFDNMDDKSMDVLLMLQHLPVFTFGTASDRAFLLRQDTDVPIVDINRGGEVTYHGPGQLVMYPILNLRRYKPDLHWYMRALEEAVMRAVMMLLQQSEKIGGSPNEILSPTRCEETTGVWLEGHKVAAIGVSARRWITQHGVAINVEERCLENFQHIVPCGLEGRKVGCLNQFLKKPITVQEFVPFLLRAMEDVFQMEIDRSGGSASSPK